MTSTHSIKKNFKDDFEVAWSGSSIIDAETSLENYRLFKSIVAEAPKKELVNRGWIDPSREGDDAYVSLFNNIQQYSLKGLCRRSHSSNSALCAFWQTRILRRAELTVVTHDELTPFSEISVGDIRNLAKLSMNPEVILELPALLLEKGIVLVYERSLKGMKLDGVVFRLISGHPVIGLSFRYSRLDNFWFTLMHELAHIALHLEQLDTPIFDNIDEEHTDILELQANKITKDVIAEKWRWRNCKAKYTNDEQDIINFAEECEVHPALIAGLLQREKNAYHLFRKITDQIDVREMVFGNE